MTDFEKLIKHNLYIGGSSHINQHCSSTHIHAWSPCIISEVQKKFPNDVHFFENKKGQIYAKEKTKSIEPLRKSIVGDQAFMQNYVSIFCDPCQYPYIKGSYVLAGAVITGGQWANSSSGDGGIHIGEITGPHGKLTDAELKHIIDSKLLKESVGYDLRGYVGGKQSTILETFYDNAQTIFEKTIDITSFNADFSTNDGDVKEYLTIKGKHFVSGNPVTIETTRDKNDTVVKSLFESGVDGYQRLVAKIVQDASQILGETKHFQAIDNGQLREVDNFSSGILLSEYHDRRGYRFVDTTNADPTNALKGLMAHIENNHRTSGY